MNTKRVVTKISAPSSSVAGASSSNIDKKLIGKIKKVKDKISEQSEPSIRDDHNDASETEMERHINHVAQIKQGLEHPVSDDTLDDLEAQVDKFTETKDLSERIKLHSILKSSVRILEEEVDQMVELIDRIDIDAVNTEIRKTTENTDRTDITDDIVNLEKMMEGMKDEEIMQLKLMYVQKITEIVKRCKSKCDSSKMKITKCN